MPKKSPEQKAEEKRYIATVNTAKRLFDVLALMPYDFCAETRVDEPPQEREDF